MVPQRLSYNRTDRSKKHLRLLQLTFVGAFVSLTGASNTAYASTTPERQCYELVQGNVAWNQAGNKQWVDGNIRSLCAGTTAPQRRVGCFKRGIRTHDNWSRAITDCKSRAETGSTGSSERRARGITRSPVEQCRNDVQGHIAWSQDGNKRWRSANLDRFCANTTVAETARRIECFEQAISSHGDWSRGITNCTNPPRHSGTVQRNSDRSASCEEQVQGHVAWNREGTTRWGAENLEDFCDGVSTHYLPLRINCFDDEVQAHNDWRRALDSCRNVGRTLGRVVPVAPQSGSDDDSGSDSRNDSRDDSRDSTPNARTPDPTGLQVDVRVVAVQATQGDDGGSDNTFEYYTKVRIKEGYDWDASSVRVRSRPEYDNNRILAGSNGLTPDRAMLPTRETKMLSRHFESPWPDEKFKVHISLWDYDEASGDDWFDINPMAGKMDAQVYVDTRANQIRVQNHNREWIVVGGNGDLITMSGAGDRSRHDKQAARIKFIIRWVPFSDRRTSSSN